MFATKKGPHLAAFEIWVSRLLIYQQSLSQVSGTVYTIGFDRAGDIDVAVYI